ncbi:Uncharacterized protein conserved in bacteria [Actinobacillus pleuropneumoniae]|nr:Uncharacterized protein conserved in bacteria [Actinobacillus pleuropneumoniae]
MLVDCLKKQGGETEGASVFMSNRILVTPEQLEQVSAQFAQSGQLSGDMVQRLQRSIHEMEGQWEGMTRERFYGDYQHARTTMLKFVECLQTISTELKQISVKFRSTDEMVNGAAAGGAVAGAGIMAGAATGAGIAAAAGAASKTSGVAAKSSSNPLDAALKGVEVEGSVIKHEENGLFCQSNNRQRGSKLIRRSACQRGCC